MRYFIELSYRGTAYNGWQIQPNAPSVQQTLQEALSKMLRESVEVVGAGRTDTGVHARYYVAHFDCSTAIDDQEKFLYHLNSVLPFDIAVSRVRRVRDDAHARSDATEREYTYLITTVKDPFTLGNAWYYRYSTPLSVEAMNRAAEALLRHTDFTTFAKLNSNNSTNICHVSYAQWRATEQGFEFVIRSNRFLRNMIRALVGTMVDVGRGKISPEEFEQLIIARDLSRASGSAPAEGLFLSNVKYPENIYL
ncbi:MAG: tRNA pseudouridine(38-40) synthase TruA [Tidjanibacter sp.]|nr:tRNA pseudouridine(38-40) synthase TruA [Tidjanibacter sp.]